jgi:hypothetical protein
VESSAGKGADATEVASSRKREGAWGGAHGLALEGGSWAGPQRNSADFDLKRIFQTEQDLIRLKTGFPLIKNFQITYGFVGN